MSGMKDEDVKAAAELCRRRRRVAATMRSRKKRGAAGWTRVCLELPSAGLGVLFVAMALRGFGLL